MIDLVKREDAMLDLLQSRFLALDTEWGERKETVLVFRWEPGWRVSASLVDTLARALAEPTPVSTECQHEWAGDIKGSYCRKCRKCGVLQIGTYNPEIGL